MEYQQTGAYVYRLYREAFGNNQPFLITTRGIRLKPKKLPLYANFRRIVSK